MSEPRRNRRAGRILILLAMLVLAFSLRPTAAALGTVLASVQQTFGFGASTAGILVTLPVLCFAALGSTTIGLVRAVGLHRAMLGCLLIIAIGSMVRAVAESPGLFWAGTLAALAGSAVGNVFLPALVKIHFPRHIARISSLVVAATIGGATAAAAITLPMAHASGSWRTALFSWGVLAAFAALPWLAMAVRETAAMVGRGTGPPFRRVARSRMAWVFGVFFALQSLHPYVAMGWLPAMLIDLGNSPARTSVTIGLAAAMAMPISLAMPRLIRLAGTTAALPLTFAALTAAGWLGFLLAPTTVPWLWGVLLGSGGGAFPWMMALIPLRTRTIAGTAALSGFVQSIGYLLAAGGPLGVGVLHDLTGEWTVSLVALVAACLPLAVLGVVVARGRWFEDTLPPPR